MDYQELAKILNGGTYRNETTKKIEQTAKENGIVIVFGASDDLMEFRGAIYDEVDCYEGGTAYLNANGLFQSKCDDDNCPYAQNEKLSCKTITSIWCGKDTDFTWSYKTDIPHATFEILDDDEKYCLGICFDLAELMAV